MDLHLLPEMERLRDEGKSLQGIADALNAEGYCTRKGKAWHAIQVSRVLERTAHAR
jgi:hypothetical protein